MVSVAFPPSYITVHVTCHSWSFALCPWEELCRKKEYHKHRSKRASRSSHSLYARRVSHIHAMILVPKEEDTFV